MTRHRQAQAVVIAALMIVSMIAVGAGGVAAQPALPDQPAASGGSSVGVDSETTSFDAAPTELHPPVEPASRSSVSAAGNGTVAPAVQNATGEQQLVITVARERNTTTTDIDTRQAASNETLDRVAETIDQFSDAEVRAQFWAGNIVTVTADLDTHDGTAFAAIDGVTHVALNSEFDRPRPPIGADDATATAEGNFTYGLEQINVPEFEAEFDTQGAGTTIMIADDGISDPENGHPDLTFAKKAIVEDGTVDEGTLIGGAEGAHGEHTAGTATGAAEPAGNVSRYGVAPDADLLKVDVFAGGATIEDIVASMQWAAENDVDAASYSLGIRPQEGKSTFTPAFVSAIEDVNAAGTVVVVSAGNEGGTGNVGGSDGGPVTSPGTNFDTVAIGAATEDRDIAAFSSGAVIDNERIEGGTLPARFPTAYVQPDVSAPGVAVLSAGPLGTEVDDETATYSTASGTSMAAPHYAGAVGLLQSATTEELDHAVIEAALAETADKPETGDTERNGRDIRFGTGIIDVHAAAHALEETQTISGTVTDTDGDPLVGATVETAAGALTATDEDGAYMLATAANPAEVTADEVGFGAETTTVADGTQTDFTLKGSPEVTLIDDQPADVTAGESFDVVFEVANLDRLTVELTETSTVSDEDLTLTVDGDPVEFGDSIDVGIDSGDLVVTVAVSEAAPIDETVELEHTFEGERVETGTTGPTTVREGPEFALTNLTQPNAVGVDENISSAVEVTNVGDQTGQTETLHLLRDDFNDDGNVSIIAGGNQTVDGDPGETVAITDDLSTVTQINNATDGVTITPGDTVAAGFQVGSDLPADDETARDDELLADILITGDGFEVSALTAPHTADVGDQITVNATIENTGASEETQAVEYRIDETVVATETVTLGSFESQTVTFEDVTVPDTTGFRTHGVFTEDDSATAPISVGVELNVTADTAFVGTVNDESPVALTATGIAADGVPVDGDPITFTVGDEPVATTTVTNGSATTTFDPAVLDADVGETLSVSIVEFAADSNASVDTVHEVVDLTAGFNHQSVPQSATLTFNDAVQDAVVWNSTDQTYDDVQGTTVTSTDELNDGIYLAAGTDDARLGYTFHETGADPGSVAIEPGWNFVGSNFNISAVQNHPLSDDLRDVDDTDLVVYDPGFSTQLNGTDEIGAFDTYWVFVPEETRFRTIITPTYDRADRTAVLGGERLHNQTQ